MTTKNCSLCKEEKDIKNFYSDRSKKFGKSNSCKPCMKKRNGSWVSRNPEKSYEIKRKWRLKTNFSITILEYDTMLKDQNHCCAICIKPQIQFKKKFAVDHCHITGKIRGLLCDSCNTSLGKMDDSVEILLRAVEYLNESR